MAKLKVVVERLNGTHQIVMMNLERHQLPMTHFEYIDYDVVSATPWLKPVRARYYKTTESGYLIYKEIRE